MEENKKTDREISSSCRFSKEIEGKHIRASFTVETIENCSMESLLHEFAQMSRQFYIGISDSKH